MEGMSTEQGIEKILDLHKRELKSLKKYLKLATDTKKLVDLLKGADMNKLMTTDLSGQELVGRLKGVEMHLQGSVGIIKVQQKDVETRLKETWKVL